MDVLVVDDERALRSALRRALTLEGYRVLESESGERAIETLTERTVDAAILDVLMPGIDGLEVCRRLRAGRPPSSTGRPPAGGGFGAGRAPSQVAQKSLPSVSAVRAAGRTRRRWRISPRAWRTVVAPALCTATVSSPQATT